MKFSYWSKFHANIITDSGVMTIFFYKGLTRNPKIGNTPVWVLPNIWRLGQVGDTKFGTSVSNKMLLNPAKCQGYSFYRFWVTTGKPTGGGGKIIPPRTRLALRDFAERICRYFKSDFSIIIFKWPLFQQQQIPSIAYFSEIFDFNFNEIFNFQIWNYNSSIVQITKVCLRFSSNLFFQILESAKIKNLLALSKHCLVWEVQTF